ncbi:Uncharacterised protein [Vibrio cholerae]|nr:Uncharacterised protein [Vibrio cholerae]
MSQLFFVCPFCCGSDNEPAMLIAIMRNDFL